MPDPLLTAKGIRQCEELASGIPADEASAIQLVVASPLRRTIYTALYTFPDLLGRNGQRILALPEAQETGAGLNPCDTGLDPDVLEREFEGRPVDLSLVLAGWNARKGSPAAVQTLRERGLWVRRWLRDRPESVICLVSHGGFLHYLTDDWEGFDYVRGTAWRNGEWRTYEYKHETGEVEVVLVETGDSKARRIAL